MPATPAPLATLLSVQTALLGQIKAKTAVTSAVNPLIQSLAASGAVKRDYLGDPSAIDALANALLPNPTIKVNGPSLIRGQIKVVIATTGAEGRAVGAGVPVSLIKAAALADTLVRLAHATREVSTAVGTTNNDTNATRRDVINETKQGDKQDGDAKPTRTPLRAPGYVAPALKGDAGSTAGALRTPGMSRTPPARRELPIRR
jgi:hypothetical protein